ncbi:MAG: glycosyltransferase [Deltaproteobacteria bacterium]|nr:glycosyltransferase [Deltaproteobacteria bacterium]
MSALAAIVISRDGASGARALLRCLQGQTLSDLEVVLVTPGRCVTQADGPLLEGFGRVVRVEHEVTTTSLARAAGIAAATAPLVVLTEDHSLPEPGWAEALVRAHGDGVAAVGPEVANGNPGSLLGWANFLIEYGEWCAPAAGGARLHLPGHNSAYRRDLLLALGDALPAWLDAESLLHRHLRSLGHEVRLCPDARTAHYNFSRFCPSLVLRFQAGRLFAGARRRPWSWPRRLAYAGGAPAIPWVRLGRVVRELLRPGRPTHLLPRLAPLLALLLSVDAAGECVGYLAGGGDAARYISDIDFHRERFMSDSEGASLR